MRRQPAHLLVLARDLAILVLVVTATCCASQGRFNEIAQAAGDGVAPLPMLNSNLAQLESLTPPPGCDACMFVALKHRLADELAAKMLPRSIPTPPSCQVANFTACSHGEGQAILAWTYRSSGDYDQNSEVNVQDLCPLGMHLGHTTQSPYWHLTRVADGDENGEVNSSDITPIAQYLGTRIESYLVESSPNGQTGWKEAALVPFTDSNVHELGGFRRFVAVVPATPGSFWRIVPQGGGVIGLASAAVEYTGAPPQLHCVMGRLTDATQQPLSGVAVLMSETSPAQTGSDGTYCFAELADGTTAIISAKVAGHVVVPASRAVFVDGADSTGIDFTAFAVTSLQANLPQQVFYGDDFNIELQALGSSGQPLAGFNTAAKLLSEPAGLVCGPAQFQNGTANVRASLGAAGTYTISLTGLDPALDGPIGSIVAVAPDIPEVSVATWRHDAAAALSLSFDDGTRDHWQRGLALWDEFGFKVTLGIISSTFGYDRVPELREAHAAGHELANHTDTHPDLATLPAAQIRSELAACRDFLLDSVPGLEYVPTVIYPYESFDSNVTRELESEGYLFARSGYQGIVDYAELNDTWDPPFLHLYSWANLNTLPVSMWNDTTDWAVSSGGWLIEQCHGIGTAGEPGVGWNPRPEAEYREHYQHIAGFGELIWVAPIGEVGTYLIERNCAQVTVSKASSERLDITVTTGLELPANTVPITIRLTQPSGWNKVDARQNGKPLALVEYSRDETPYLRCDVMPDAGVITITRR